VNTVGRQVLRTLAVLVVLQVLTSFVGAWLLGRMTPAVERILVENERSLEAVERMALALAEAKHVSEAQPRFVAALEIAEGNVTEEAERTELRALRERHEAAFAGDRRAQERVVEALSRLGRINRDAMERSNQEAQRLGLAGAWVVALFGVIGLLGSVIAVVRTRRRLVAPLRVLADVVTDHARGSSHRRCPRTQGGELGEVLGNVNELLDRIERAKPKPEALDPREEALLRLLDAREEATWILDEAGSVKAANAAALDALATEPALRARLAEAVTAGTFEGAKVTAVRGGALIERG
jgi:PAS domain-containing protein